MKLHRNGTNWNRDERNKTNENWDEIEGNYNNVVENVSDKAFDKVVDSAKLNWKEPVDTLANLPSDAVEGDTRMVRETGKVYRFNGSEWQEIQEIDVTAINEVEERFMSRFAKTEERLSFSDLKANELNYYDMLNKNSTGIEGHVLKVIGDRSLLTEIKLTNKDSIELEFRKNNLDDFIKFRTAILKLTNQTTDSSNYSSVTAGKIDSDNTNNHYTRTIGTKLELKFTGTEVYFASRVDENGGLWKCSIDGEEVGKLSTHVNGVSENDKTAASVAKQLIADSLENKSHTLVMEFVGQDPKHPVSNPRGWIRYNDGTAGDPAQNLDTFEWVKESVKNVSMLSDSNKEFAFNLDKTDAGTNRQWFPEHNSLGTLFKGEQSLYVDGVKKSISKASVSEFKEVQIYQKLYGKHPAFSGNVCEIIIIATINYLGVNFETKVKWLQSAFVFNGYVNMFTLDTDFANNLITSYGNNYKLDKFDGSLEHISQKIPYYFTSTSDNYKDFFITLSSHSPKRTYRFGEGHRGGNEEGENFYYIQHRSASLQKLYPVVINAMQVKKDDVYSFDGHFGFGHLPNATELLS